MEDTIKSIIGAVSRFLVPHAVMGKWLIFPALPVISFPQKTAGFPVLLKNRIQADCRSLSRYLPVSRITHTVFGVPGISDIPVSPSDVVTAKDRTFFSGMAISGKISGQAVRKELAGGSHPVHNSHDSFCGGCDLAGQSVLCVGGRARLYCEYRRLVKAYGGHLVICRSSRTEAGDRDSPVRCLDTLLACADMVVCPVDCIDHHDYFTVKRYCARTGKPCAFLHHSGLPAFCKGVEVLGGICARAGNGCHALTGPRESAAISSGQSREVRALSKDYKSCSY